MPEIIPKNLFADPWSLINIKYILLVLLAGQVLFKSLPAPGARGSNALTRWFHRHKKLMIFVLATIIGVGFWYFDPKPKALQFHYAIGLLASYAIAITSYDLIVKRVFMIVDAIFARIMNIIRGTGGPGGPGAPPGTGASGVAK